MFKAPLVTEGYVSPELYLLHGHHNIRQYHLHTCTLILTLQLLLHIKALSNAGYIVEIPQT